MLPRIVTAAAVLLSAAVVQAAPPEAKTTDSRASVITAEMWKSAPVSAVKPADIDALINKELKDAGIKSAPRTTDEQFLRRVMLDLTGELPLPADVTEFVDDKAPNKRAKMIDKLLASDEFARHWARYWHDVIGAHATNQQARILGRSFEVWMTEQFKDNKSWATITRSMLTANGKVEFTDDGTHGDLYFLLTKNGMSGPEERASETSRIFLGIQIQCAQCHDHPHDVWKRQQFHEFVGYFARGRDRLVRDPNTTDPKQARFIGLELVSTPFGEHRMPSKTDPNPRAGTTVNARFLDGKGPRPGLDDLSRRKSLADAVVSKDNYWYAAAYVNRMWGELMGQSFYTPVDDLGPQKEAVFPSVITRLAASFRATDYDMKELFRTITNSEAYQRQIRLGESSSEHLMFAAVYPTRLRADALWASLTGVLGNMAPVGPGGMGRFGGGMFGPGRFGLEGTFKDEFSFDPSTKADEVESSIQQALMMMNNPQINQKIAARGTNLLGRILSAYPNDDDALRMVYLRTLARKPTDREKERCRTYIAKPGSRAEAFEDILWALLNSTEFQTKR